MPLRSAGRRRHAEELPEVRPRERVVFDDLAIGETVEGETLGCDFLPTGTGDLAGEAGDHHIPVATRSWMVKRMPETAAAIAPRIPLKPARSAPPIAVFT